MSGDELPSTTYTEFGSGSPVVVLDDNAGTPPVMHELLAASCHVIVFDLGNGGLPATDIPRVAREAAGEPYALVASRAASTVAADLVVNEPDVASVAFLAPTTRLPTSVAIPAMVVLGTEDDVTPANVGQEFVAGNPDAFLMFVYKAGQLVEHDRPEAVANLLTRFVQHGREWVVSREDTRLAP